MAETLRCVGADSVITSWDFSTGAVKCLAFDLHGQTLAEVRLPTDLWTEGGVSELSLFQLEGQARASTRRRLMSSKHVDGNVLDHAAPLVHQHAPEIQPYGHLVRLPIALSETVCRESVEQLNQLLAASTRMAFRCAGPFAGTTIRWRNTMRAAWKGSGGRSMSSSSLAVRGPFVTRSAIS